MRLKQAKNLMWLVMGLAVGFVGLQLLWPLVGEAQTPTGPVLTRPEVVRPPVLALPGPRFNIRVQVPDPPRLMMTYRTVPPDLSPERLKQLAQAFGLSGEFARWEESLHLEQGDRTLVMLDQSGGMFFDDHALLDRVGHRQLPSVNEAAHRADEFLKQHDLLPSGAYRTHAETVRLTRQDKPGAELVTEDHEVQVDYAFRVGGREVFGPGAKASLIVTEGGQVAGYWLAWRELTTDKSVRTRSADEAVLELRRKGNWNLLRQAVARNAVIEITEVSIGYWAEELGKDQPRLEPVMLFEGTSRDFEGRQVAYLQRVSLVAGQVEPTLPPSPRQRLDRER